MEDWIKEERSPSKGNDGHAEKVAKEKQWILNWCTKIQFRTIRSVCTFLSYYSWPNHVYSFRIVQPNITLISKAFRHQFIIPEFQDFAKEIEEIYWKCKDNTNGKVISNDQNSLIRLAYFHFLGGFLYSPTETNEPQLLGR